MITKKWRDTTRDGTQVRIYQFLDFDQDGNEIVSPCGVLE